MITVIANFHARKGDGDKLAAVIPSHAAATRSETGCELFSAYRSRDDADDFIFVEQYSDRQAFEAHRQSSHYVHHVREGMLPLLDGSMVAEYDEIAAPAPVGTHAPSSRRGGQA